MTSEIISTDWIVLTGAPCAGKTSIIKELQKLGHQICNEAAEKYILSQRSTGKTTAEIIQNRHFLISEITRTALEQEAALKPTSRIFLDRSSFDTVAYCEVFGETIPYQKDLFRRRYAGIFHLDRLPLQEDRLEQETEASLLDASTYQNYIKNGYRVIKVPILAFHDRVQFILDHLSDLTDEQ